MVTWGVTGAGGRVVGSNPSEDGTDSAATAPERAGRASGTEESRESPDSSPSETGTLPPITVEPTPASLARGLSVASAALTTTGPRRSHPAHRRRPPAMTVGERTRIPDRLADRSPDVDVTLVLPPHLPSLFVTAPLAYYLPASIDLREDASPRLIVEGETRAELEHLEADAGALLRRVFYLDCAIRRDGLRSADHYAGADGVLDRLGLDPYRLRTAPATERLTRYLAAWEADVDDALPEWHLSTAVEPTPAAIAALPSLLDRLSLVELADGDPRRRPDLLERTLDGAYRTRGASGDADVVTPSDRVGRSQGWLAPGRPIEAFKPTNTAFEHRQRYDGATDGDGGDGGEHTVAVVLGDGSMREEYRDVASVYRERGSAGSVDVAVAPTRAELRSLLRAGHVLVHYVGHCDEAGLRCTDGHLAAADVAPCRTPAFVLNACGSYDQGLALVERGAVAGAVTFTDVLDDHAVRVGTALARLLVEGFSVQRATELARRRILMGQDYAAVGDATYAPWQDRHPPGVLWIEPARSGPNRNGHDEQRIRDDPPEGDDCAPADAFEVTYEMTTLRQTGAFHRVPFGRQSVLNGDAVSKTLSGKELTAILEDGRYPVVWQGDLFWSMDVKDRFRR